MCQYRFVFVPAVVAFVAGCSAAPVADESTKESSQALFVETGTQLWKDASGNNVMIPVCFTQSRLLVNDHARERNMIQAAIQRTWQRAANIPVSWNGTCPTSGDGQYLKINLGPHTQEDGSTDGQTSTTGMAAQTAASTPVNDDLFQDPGIRIWIQDDGNSGQSRLEYVAVHEFGHVLGFAHEQDRPDEIGCAGGGTGTGTKYGPYDPDSVMNYCADVIHGYLSEGDVMNVRSIYGFRNDYRNLSADVNGDGLADALVVNSDAIYVMLSGGTTFNWSGQWTSAPFFGYRETLIGDVNGDGKADMIAVDNSGNYVMLSDGTKFNWAGKWSTTFNGSRKTIAADLNGDGKMDLIAVNNGGLFVMLSDGTQFNWAGQWAPSFYGTRGTYAGDVNGDGLADIVTLGINGWTVALNTGSSFDVANAYSGTFSVNSRVTAIADVNGDGRADLVTLNDWGANVLLSANSSPTGVFGGFGANQSWAGPFYGDRSTLVADVNGDGLADAIAVSQSGQYVATSNGQAFLWDGQWSTNFVSQPY